MTSHKEEPNPSILFGDSAGDDPFSQMLQQTEEPKKVDEKKVDNEKKTLADVSGLFGNSTDNGNNNDLFFSQPVQAPLTSNASGASFFEQPVQANSESFFDGTGQQAANTQPGVANNNQQAASLTQPFDPNTYSNYEYSQQPEQNTNDTTATTGNYDQQQQQQVEYDPNQWIQFDPNSHYYYDEQGQVHYYDPNTNQEYDMSQYTYDEQAQTYDYQYDPQYAEYYAQQGYDPATYAAVSTEPTTATYDASATTEQTYDQTNYDPNAYAPVTEQTNNQDYYNPQSYTSVNNAVAEVPAQIQSEQTIDTQHYSSQQYEYQQQNYVPEDTTTTNQPQDYNYQGYEATDLQYAPTHDNNGFTAVNQDYSQSDFFAEDLQQQQPVSTNDFDAPPMAPPKEKSVLSPHPPPPAAKRDILPPPPKNAAPPPRQFAAANPPQEQQEAVVPSEISEQMESYDVVTTTDDNQTPVDLNDLDDLIFGESKKDDCDQQASDELDLLISGSSLDINKEKTDTKEFVYNNPNQYEEETTLIKLENTAVVLAEPEQKVPENDTKHPPQATESKQVESQETHSYEPQQIESQETHSYEPQQVESQETYSYEPQQASEQTVDYSSYEPQQASEQTVGYSSYEPQQQTVDYSSYEPEQQPENPVDYSSYEPQQKQSEQTVDYSSYEPQQKQSEQTVDYSSYEPHPQHDQAVDYSSYEPQQHDQNSYEPQQQTEQAVDYSGYLPQEPVNYYQQQNDQTAASYEPQQQTEQTVDYSGYLPQQQAVDYSSYEPQHVASEVKQSEATVAYSTYTPQDASYSMYQPQQVDEKPKQTERAIHSSYTPQHDTKPPQASEVTPNQELPPPPKRSVISPPPPPPPPPQRNMVSTPPPRSIISPPPPRSMVSPPPRSMVSPPPRRNMISPSPAASAMHSFSQQRSNSITEPDRKQNGSPFTGYYNQHIERSATVPPPMTERTASPRPILTACPDPECEGENKAKAKFCCECGRPLAGISRSTTPSANMSPGVFTTYDHPMIPNALDQKKEKIMSSLKKFMEYSVIVQNEEKQKLALEYIDSRVPEFEESKALLWNIVKLMIQYQDHTLGDGGELDKSITKLLCTQSNEQTNLSLDKLEEYLIQGDKDGACQFAVENDMWAHALIISQNQSSESFKRVMSQFIDRELFSTGDELKVQVPGNKKALRMLYSVFSGAGADAVLELARNSVDDHPTVFTKESLQDWKKALGLVLCNRSSNDLEAIKGLGDQLKKTDSLQDAYICYMLSPDTFMSLESQIIATEGIEMYMNLDALYLTELYEFGLSKNNLNQYKLILAWWLTQFGFTHESKVYCDMISKHVSSDELQQFKKLGEICNTSTDSDVTSLLNKETFEKLIGSIEENVSSNQTVPTYQGTSSFGYMQDDSNGMTHDFTGQEAHDTLQGENYNYGYSYGGGYTESADNNEVTTTTPFGMKSPFQNNVRPVSSPFAVGVRSPFQHSGSYVPTETTSTVEPSYEPYQPETPAVASYQPDAYAPTSQTDVQTTVLDDDEDDLGFGNSKPKSVKKDTHADEDDTKAEKPNEVGSNEEKKEITKGGWGLFSLFGRKEKESTAEEKKAVKANLGEQSSFYYDEKEKRWVNKLNDSKPAVAATPPPPKAATPQPTMSSPAATAPPPSSSSMPPPSSSSMAPPPPGGLKPASMPPMRINSTPNVPTTGGPPNVSTPTFNTPPTSRRAGAGTRKPMRSRYVDVLNTK